MSRIEITPDILIDPVLLDFSKTCRLCLHHSTELSPLFPETEPSDEAISSLPSKIMACVSIEVLPEHNTMPKQVCSKCIQQIDSWVKFKELCESSNVLLQQCLANLQASSNDDAETLQNNLHGPDTLLSDMDVSIFERDSLFGALEDGSIHLSNDLNLSFSESMLNGKIQPTKKIIGNTSTPNRLNENFTEISRNALSNGVESFSVKKENSEPKTEGPSKWKLRYDVRYKKSYPCDICKRVFSKFLHLLNHDRTEHGDCLGNFSCDICGMIFVSQSRIDIHILKHRDKKFECSECHGMFISKKSLSVHKKRHSPDNRFKCSSCNAVHTSQVMLDNHVRSVHNKELPFRCDLCGKEFATEQSKVIHYRRHSNRKMFKCGVCGVMSANHNSFNAHKEKHKSSKDIVCMVCGKLFKTMETLNQHKRVHNEKGFKCLICSLSFSQKYLLVRHESRHLNLFPHPCNICTMSFRRKDELTSHLVRIHSSNKESKCSNAKNNRIKNSNCIRKRLKNKTDNFSSANSNNIINSNNDSNSKDQINNNATTGQLDWLRFNEKNV